MVCSVVGVGSVFVRSFPVAESIALGLAGQETEVDGGEHERLGAGPIGVGGDAPLERLDEPDGAALGRLELGAVGQPGPRWNSARLAVSMP